MSVQFLVLDPVLIPEYRDVLDSFENDRIR